jgi:type I restriction enzyme, S subunit
MMRELPKNWTLTDLETVCIKITDGTHYTPPFLDKGYPFVTVKHVKDERIDFTKTRYISKEHFEKLKNNCNPKAGDVLFSKDGTVGKVVPIDFEKEFIILSSLALLRPHKDILLQKYLEFYLRSPRALNEAIGRKTGTAIRRIILKNLRKVSFPLATFKEQQRIVEKLLPIIDDFQEIQNRLNRVPELFIKIRQSILDTACEGKLTKSEVQEWEDTSFGEISSLITKGSSPKWQGINYTDKGILFVTSENVGNGHLILHKKKYLDKKFNKIQQRSILKKGDLLTNIVGASIGRSAIFDLEVEANINQAVAIIRLNKNILPEFALLVLESSPIKTFMHGNKSDSARANLSLRDVSSFPIKVPPLKEQRNILRTYNKIMHNYQNLVDSVSKIRIISERIEASILKIAFEGRLVKQDPLDESASVLLERISEEQKKVIKRKGKV